MEGILDVLQILGLMVTSAVFFVIQTLRGRWIAAAVFVAVLVLVAYRARRHRDEARRELGLPPREKRRTS
jgi:uncharacterized membrane protein